jgi:hypothetical protein
VRTTGIHFGVPPEEYHGDPAEQPSLSSSIANVLLTRSALHAKFKHPRLTDEPIREESDTLDRGTVAHAMLLGGLENVVAVEPTDFPGKRGGIPDGWTNDAIRAERERIRAEGKVPVLVHVYETARRMSEIASEALAKCEVPILLADGWSEVTLIWKEGDVYCRARPDWMHKDRKLILDYKSTATSAQPDSWIRRQLVTMGYDLQAAHYSRGNRMTGGDGAADFLFLVQENEPPFACSIIAPGAAVLDIAERKRDFAVQIWGQRMKEGNWPGYSNRIHYAEPTPWQIADDDTAQHLTLEERLELGGQA